MGIDMNQIEFEYFHSVKYIKDPISDLQSVYERHKYTSHDAEIRGNNINMSCLKLQYEVIPPNEKHFASYDAKEKKYIVDVYSFPY